MIERDKVKPGDMIGLGRRDAAHLPVKLKEITEGEGGLVFFTVGIDDFHSATVPAEACHEIGFQHDDPITWNEAVVADDPKAQEFRRTCSSQHLQAHFHWSLNQFSLRWGGEYVTPADYVWFVKAV